MKTSIQSSPLYMIQYMMRSIVRLIPLAPLAVLVACGSDSVTRPCCITPGGLTVRVVNAFTTPIDVLIDGSAVIQSMPVGFVATAGPPAGTHIIVFRPTAGDSASTSVTTAEGAMNTLAAVRASNGTLASVVLDDTNSVVPAGATKVRVLHLAPNAGVLQVYRTQPDFQQPISWQFPFTYQSNPDALSAPFFQSTVGSWDIRVWQTPADATGWATAPATVVIPLKSGEKKTVLILDKPGGGVILQVI
jgi:hypothetical protein